MIRKTVVDPDMHAADADSRYREFFSPSPGTLRPANQQALFEIYTAVDYSIPVTCASNAVMETESDA